jgi:hypothetical protein
VGQARQSTTRAQWQPLWVDYVKQHLLPRLYAFELMMAPYAIAHMKIGLKLAETGYTFPEDGPRVNVFLTNALEPAHAINPGLEFEAPMLAHEAAAANRVKEQLAATVVVGNPPYSGESGNKGEWIANLMRSRLTDGSDSYFRFDDADLGERNPKWINNDYVKFIRLAQSRLATLGTGVMGYITSNSYLESPTFRGVRQSLLHIDQNVFEIQEGVAIAIGAISGAENSLLWHVDLFGLRESKYEQLGRLLIQNCPPFVPTGVQLKFVRAESASTDSYETGWPLPTLLLVNSVGIVTARDALCIQFTEKQAWDTVRDFGLREVEDARSVYALGDDARDWRVALAQHDVNSSGPSKKHLQPILYRPFDTRQTYYTAQTRGFLCMPRPEMRHMLAVPNLALISARINKGSYPDHFFCTRLIMEAKCGESTTQSALFPLWSSSDGGRIANLSDAFVAAVQSALDLDRTDYRPEGPSAPMHAEKIFHYLYAVLHSPAYRQRYAAFLAHRLPAHPHPRLTRRVRRTGLAGCAIGAMAFAGASGRYQKSQLVAPDRQGRWPGLALTSACRRSVRRASRWRMYPATLARSSSTPPAALPTCILAVWQHTIGGYQVLHKWLDDRRKAGRSLSPDDITHWLRVYAALQATQKLMLQVDEAIETHGGWPGAFSQNHPPPDAATLAGEQMAQKGNSRRRRKPRRLSKIANNDQGTLGFGLFDADSDLDELAAASGAPPRPKSRATPAKAAGGKASTSPAKADDITDWQAMCAIRAVLARADASALTRPDLIRATARELGFARTSPRLGEVLETAIRRAVRRGIAESSRGELTLVAKTIAGYDRDFLKQHLLGVITGSWCDRADVPVRFARALGFARTGPKIEETVWALMRALLRVGLAEVEGRGSEARYRKAKGAT